MSEAILVVTGNGVPLHQELRRALVDTGYQVVITAGAEEGLRFAAEPRPTAVVADGTELRVLEDGAKAFVRNDEDLTVILARLAAMLRSAGAPIAMPATAGLSRPKRILAVDDSVSYRHRLADALKGEGYDVMLARSGEKALELLGEQPFDCVLLDLLMPGLGGEETCRRIKSAPAIRDTPLVMLTALENHETIVRLLGAGADDFIAKSSDIEVLKARVRAQIRRKQLEDESRHIREQLLRNEREAAEARVSEELRAQSEKLAASQVELTLRNEELARASRLKSDFLASMSHELRTPLNAVVGFSELLLAGDYGSLAPQQQPVVQDVLAAGHQLLTLINDVLDLSKIEAGRIEVHRLRVDIAEPVDEACNLLANAARKRAITLVTDISAGRLFANADPDRLRQVLVNLVSNAVKFTPDGGTVTLDASLVADHVRVTVTDTGIGIAPADAPKLFAPFSQLDSGYTRRFAGTGLGLSICKKLVELMGGEIGFTSEPGKGSIFFFTLPAAPARQTNAPQGLRSFRATLPPHAPSAAGKRPTVFVVEDEEPDGRVVESALRGEGYVVVRAHTAEQALAMVDDVGPALFVINLCLPGLSGFELIERLRALPAYARAPIAVLTAIDLTPEDRARLADQVQAIVQKGDSSRAGFFRHLARMSARTCPRILVVDDSEMNRKVIHAMLARAPCEVIEVADAAAGIQAAREHAPAVILMDIQMPEMDGLTATAHLKADPATSAIPVIAVTAHAMAGDAERALAAGCIAYVSKPISRARLNDALDLALGGDAWRTG